MGMALGHYMKSDMEYILSKFAIILLMLKYTVIFVSDNIASAKMLQKQFYETKYF